MNGRGSVDMVELTRTVHSVGCEIVTKEALDDLTRRAAVRRDDRAALRRIHGLLCRRRWWNDNVWAARRIAQDRLLDVRRGGPS